MSYCLNLTCSKPQNPDTGKFCQNCGMRLLLGDRYRAYQPIGGGNSSRTFVAIDTQKLFDPRCILKQFSSKGEEEEFRQEAARLDELGQHPQIPDLYAYFERDRQQFLVQEFINGRSLLQQLNEEGTFDETQIRQLLLEILPLLEFLHTRKIIHRDIKPSNLIRTSDRLVLVDFGAIKYVTKSALERTGTVLGSAEYVAPEQLMGKAIFASDLYSLGVTCIHLLTGLRPFDLFNSSTGAWFWESVAGTVSDRLTQTINKLLKVEANQRYQSATEVIKDLKEPAPTSKIPNLETVIYRLPKIPDLSQSSVPDSQQWTCIQTLNTDTEVSAIALTQNTLISGSNTGILQLWDLESGELRSQQNVHSSTITTLALSPDYRQLITGSRDKTIKLWNLEALDCLRTFSGHIDIVNSVVVSSKAVLISSSADRTINLWELQTGKLICTLTGHTGAVESIALSSDDQFLASGDSEGSVKIWHLGTRERLRTLSGHAASVSTVAFLPDRPIVISGSWDMTIKLRNLNTGGLKHTLFGHLLPITALAISPDRSLLATASHDKTIKLWNFDGQPIATLIGHTDAIEAILFSPGGQIISGSRDRTLKIWQRDP